ncbi:sodium channel modifier 1 isoform X2 [Aquila chrysaetos chrysaetos]|uniref:sodium channel modifier 1 isoform X2 n=1 Tax=Aquila chrysaetos chrysaetos TaxID=223781 RepID=UPI001177244B|nr:sodium channel modifier 1 isoform X2 [Aquila chrysaetos chrysaetos]
MSFKREGDDPGQLGVLQKRRVADLLANYIPEDEALLLRSGRYACTVCAHRPIFDTLDVLTVHRAGKKHMGSLHSFYGRKCSLQDVAQKRQHEEGVQAEEAGMQGSPAPLLARTRRIARNALLKAAPYSSCCRRMGVEGSSSRPGVTQTGLSAAPTLPSQKDGEAVDASPAALLVGHCDTLKAAPAQTQQGGKGKASSPALSRPEARSPERRQALERYLQLRSAGWIQDRSGKWVKDENAEFDSDEDEPPVLLPA